MPVLSWFLAVTLQLYLSALFADVASVSSSISAVTALVLPSLSPDDVVLSCEVVGEDYSPLWELSGRQIPSTISDRFIVQDSPDGRSSTLTVTETGRTTIGLELITVECHADNSDAFRLVKGDQILHIVQFDAPGPVVGLELVYHSVTEIRLQWLRPPDIHEDVDISYDITINNTATDVTTLVVKTSETYVSVTQNTEEMCQQHIFSVTARNSAGSSPPSDIVESIPISLNIAPISLSQTVGQLVISDTGVDITVSFQPANHCSARFPILNHTVSVAGLNGSVIADSAADDLVSVTLSSSHIPQLTVDQLYNIIITACTAFTCRSPLLPLVAVTTDTQTASVVFYSTSVSLNCSFAEGSTVTGCLFVFILTNDDNLTENVSVSYSPGDDVFNTSCDQLSNTRGAYDDVVLVYDIEADGSIGVQPLTATVTVQEDPENFTCPLPFIRDRTTSDSGLSTGAIAGIVVVSLVAVVFIIVSIAMLVLLVLVKKERKVHPGQTWYESVKVVLGPLIHGWEDTDDAGREFESFPMVRLSCVDGDSVSLQLVQCDTTKRWISEFLKRRHKRDYVHLYPEKVPS